MKAKIFLQQERIFCSSILKNFSIIIVTDTTNTSFYDFFVMKKIYIYTSIIQILKYLFYDNTF